jgi:hypothetical protein
LISVILSRASVSKVAKAWIGHQIDITPNLKQRK